MVLGFCLAAVAAWMALPLIGPAGQAPQDRALPAFGAAGDDLKIVALGTSLTASSRWPDDLEAELSRCLDQPVQVSRVAVPGKGSAWALSMLDRVRDIRPDLVIVEFAINDADLMGGVSLNRSRLQHDALLSGLRDLLPAQAGILLMTTNPVTGVVRRLQRPALGSYYRQYRDLAAEHGTGLADLWPRWQAALRHARLLPDGLHPGDAAASRMIVPVLEAMIVAAYGDGQDC